MIVIKTEYELQIMRECGHIMVELLNLLADMVKPGVRTCELDHFAEEFILSKGCKPAFKGYRGYPATLCVSVDNEVIHGIPSDRKLHEGEIVSIDVGIFYRGYYTDAARTYRVGKVDTKRNKLIQVTHEALQRAIKVAIPGKRLGDISREIYNYVRSQGFDVVREFTGHGVGKFLHEDPMIPNYVPYKWQNLKLQRHMTLAIEPMVVAGKPNVYVKDDNWTVVTKDNEPAAHFEDTVVVNNHPEVLTADSLIDSPP